ncbi:MAG TPA: hypothetical protein VLI69_01625 [Gammaproteobacteria bacterium]|nr:hypothetical protein [Gammaproteobacteria bacterium]
MQKYKHLGIYIFGILSVLAMASYPLWQAGFDSDDAYNSSLRGLLLAEDKSLIPWLSHMIVDWLHAGRFFPLALISTYGFWYYCSNLLIYRIFHWLLLVSCLFAFSGTVYKMTRNIQVGLFFLVIAPLFWSVTQGWSCFLTSFAPLGPLITLLIIFSIYSFYEYLQNNKLIYYLFSLGGYSLALLTYEISIIIFFVIMVFSLKYIKSLKTLFKTLVPFAFLTIVYFAFVHFYKLSVGYEGVQFGQLKLFGITYLKQFMAAFPLSYYFFMAQDYFYYNYNHLIVNYSFIYLLIVALFVTSFLIICSLSRFTLSKTAKFNCLVLGGSFAFVPPVLIGISKKYQSELVFGVGHLVVFIQQMGLSLIFVLLISLVNEYFINKSIVAKVSGFFFRILISLVISLGISFAMVVNDFSVYQENLVIKYLRNLFALSLQNGLVKTIPELSTILTKHLYPWDGQAFVMQTVRAKMQFVNGQDKIYQKFYSGLAKPDKMFYLDYEILPDSLDSGFVVLGQIHSLFFKSQEKNQNLMRLQLEKPRIFLTYKSDKDFNQIVERLAVAYKFNLKTKKHLLSECSKKEICVVDGFFDVSS